MNETVVHRGWTITRSPRHTITGEVVGEQWKGECKPWLPFYGNSLDYVKARIDSALDEIAEECEEDDHKYWLNSNGRP